MYDVKVHNSGRGKKECKNDMYDKRNFHRQGHENKR